MHVNCKLHKSPATGPRCIGTRQLSSLLNMITELTTRKETTTSIKKNTATALLRLSNTACVPMSTVVYCIFFRDALFRNKSLCQSTPRLSRDRKRGAGCRARHSCALSDALRDNTEFRKYIKSKYIKSNRTMLGERCH